MLAVDDRLSGNGGQPPPSFPAAGGSDGEDDGGVRYSFVFIGGKFIAITTKN